MNKFFVESNQIYEDKITILGEDINHIKNVLRLANGSLICICDKQNCTNYICEINLITKEKVECLIKEKLDFNSESNIKIDIFQGLPKSDKMELIIQKGTELGVSSFIPVEFKRTVVKIDKKQEDKKILRWQKIAEASAKQSKRNIIPKVENIKNVKNICNLFEEYDIVLVAYEQEENCSIKEVLKSLKNENKKELKIGVIVGPEGGIAEDEIKELTSSGAKSVSLGKRILRTETVALAVSAIINYELED